MSAFGRFPLAPPHLPVFASQCVLRQKMAHGSEKSFSDRCGRAWNPLKMLAGGLRPEARQPLLPGKIDVFSTAVADLAGQASTALKATQVRVLQNGGETPLTAASASRMITQCCRHT